MKYFRLLKRMAVDTRYSLSQKGNTKPDGGHHDEQEDAEDDVPPQHRQCHSGDCNHQTDHSAWHSASERKIPRN